MAMESVPQRGSLEETPLPRLLLQLYGARFGGALHLARERLEKSFRFQEGLPITAESNRGGETLSQQLVEAGVITPEAQSEVAGYVEREHCKEGTALLALALIDAKGLVQAMKDQVRRQLVACFGWPCGEFRIGDREQAAAEAQPFRADLYALLQEGIETHWSTDRILADLEPRMGRFPRRNGCFERIESRLASDPGVQSYLDALDGSQPLWKALQAATTPRAMAAAWVLDAADALDYGSAPAAQAAGNAAPEIEIRVESAAASAKTAGAASAAAGHDAARGRTPEAETLEREIADKFEHLRKLTHYELLDLDPTAAAAAVKNAYLAAAKTYHPDTLARSGVDPQTREQANKVFAAIGTAYTVLSHPRKRKDYDAALRNDEPELDAERLANAETLYRKGEILMRSGKFKDAVGFLRPAVELWPEEAAYQAGLGWALFKKRPPEVPAARNHLEKAVELDAGNAQTWYHLSLVLREVGEANDAAKALERAKRIDPNVV